MIHNFTIFQLSVFTRKIHFYISPKTYNDEKPITAFQNYTTPNLIQLILHYRRPGAYLDFPKATPPRRRGDVILRGALGLEHHDSQVSFLSGSYGVLWKWCVVHGAPCLSSLTFVWWIWRVRCEGCFPCVQF